MANGHETHAGKKQEKHRTEDEPPAPDLPPSAFLQADRPPAPRYAFREFVTHDGRYFFFFPAAAFFFLSAFSCFSVTGFIAWMLE